MFGDQISIADLSAAHELESGTLFMDIDLANKWPKTNQWMYEVIDKEPVNLKMVAKMRQMGEIAKERFKKALPKL